MRMAYPVQSDRIDSKGRGRRATHRAAVRHCSACFGECEAKMWEARNTEGLFWATARRVAIILYDLSESLRSCGVPWS